MLKMFHNRWFECCDNDRGIGLVAAIFVIVVVGMFGTLIARYSIIGSTSSAEDYHWAQALYSAQSAANVAILYSDGGGTGVAALSNVAGFSTSVVSIVSGVRASASRTINNTDIHREIEVHISL